MDGELVLGCKISVKFHKEKGNNIIKTSGAAVSRNRAVSESEVTRSSPKQMYSASASVAGARTLQIPHYQSSSPVAAGYPIWTGIHCAPVAAPPGIIQPPPIFAARPYPKNNDVTFNRTYNELARVQSPIIWQIPGSQQFGPAWEEQYKVEKARVLGKRAHVPQARDSDGSGRITPEGFRRIRGTHSSLPQNSVEWIGAKQPYNHLPLASNYNTSGNASSNAVKRRSPSPLYEVQERELGRWVGQNQYQVPVRNNRTPSPYENNSLRAMCQMDAPYQPSDTENEEVEKFFNPINNRNGSNTSNGTYTPIELQVTNLDQNIEPKEMKRILSSVFMEHVAVLHVSVFMQSDGNFAASVKVPSLSDAQYAISQLHRRKVGYKRILISYAHTGGPNPQLVRAQVVMLLQEVPGHELPLFKFREMYESRFMISISISELYKMKDVCVISENPCGRMVSLNPDHRNTPSPRFNNSSQEGQMELPYCTVHTPKPWSDKGWAEQEMAILPNVNISLRVLGPRIHQLLIAHNGTLPLPSLPNCYKAEFKEQLQVVENGGVPLEHLISCLSSVELKQGIGCVKYLAWSSDKNQDDSHEENKCANSPLANQLALFSRELVDLLKTAPRCQLLFNRFIPAYHHHFGRQCRVADYGFTKLIDLLEALSHTVQVMGEGNKRVVTLSHRAQVRRFTSDLLRVLKSKASKQIMLSEFPTVYTRVIAKPWDIVDYGVCDIEDMLNEVSENTVVVTALGNDKTIAIPKREQTPEEIEKTKQFAIEVVELLRHAPQCRMLFNKFVPSYHHHFGHQCRVSDYGFTKLIELFEAIPHVVKIEDVNGGERQISLTEAESLRVLSEQISKLIESSKDGLNVSSVPQCFLRQFGYALRPELFGCNSTLQLMQKLQDSIKIVDLGTGPMVMIRDKSRINELTLQCRRILMDQPEYSISVERFQQLYFQYYRKSCNIYEFEKDLSGILEFVRTKGEASVKLSPLHCFACNLFRVMTHYGGKLEFSQFEKAYFTVIGSTCKPAQYNFPSLLALLQALPCTVAIKDTRDKRRIIYLNKKLAVATGISLSSTHRPTTSYHDTDSSNESVESDSSSWMNASNMSVILEEREKWSKETSMDGKKSWKPNEETNLWTREPADNNWKIVKKLEDSMHDWPISESGGDFLKSLMCTPLGQHDFPPPPPKPDSPPEESANEGTRWKSSVWMSPVDYRYSKAEHTNVDIPPLTLPSWNQIDSESSISNLLSPTKSLLSAAANPLNPSGGSPYYSAKRNLVIAPHPSELPLPSLSLTPKKNATAKKTADLETEMKKRTESINCIDNSIRNGNSNSNESEDKDDTSIRSYAHSAQST